MSLLQKASRLGIYSPESEKWKGAGGLTPKLKQVIYMPEWVRIEEFVAFSWCKIGRPPHERAWLANAFVAKSVLKLTTTVGLIERMTIDRALGMCQSI